jgi:SP family sugar:H+ symporter-like MFS transporter
MPYWLSGFATEMNDKGEPALNASQNSLIVSILSAGTFFGALTAAPFGDFLGRRMGLIVSTGVVFNLGVILQTAATEQPLFIAGRFFAGYGVGLVSALSKWHLLHAVHSICCWGRLGLQSLPIPSIRLLCLRF